MDNSLDFSQLIDAMSRQSEEVKKKLELLKDKEGNLSIADMFQMQMAMNQLAQLSEMSSSIMSATNSAMTSIARNIKG